MPVDALRSVEAQFDRILRLVRAKRLVTEIKIADPAFFFRYFKGYRPGTIGRGRLKKIASREIFTETDGHDLFANLIIVHWNEGQADLYREMVKHVQTINEDVEAVEAIEDSVAHAMIDDLLTRHERDDVLICVKLNGVRFSDEVIESRLVRGEDAPEGTAKAPAKAEATADDGEPEAKAAAAESEPSEG